MSIRAMVHMPYTNYRNFVAESIDFVNLPHDCGDRSTCIMSDTGKEYVFHKQEKTWREEKRSIPELAYRGETDSIEHCYLHPAYGDMQLIRKTATNVYMVYWNGVKWKALEEEKEN